MRGAGPVEGRERSFFLERGRGRGLMRRESWTTVECKHSSFAVDCGSLSPSFLSSKVVAPSSFSKPRSQTASGPSWRRIRYESRQNEGRIELRRFGAERRRPAVLSSFGRKKKIVFSRRRSIFSSRLGTKKDNESPHPATTRLLSPQQRETSDSAKKSLHQRRTKRFWECRFVFLLHKQSKRELSSSPFLVARFHGFS